MVIPPQIGNRIILSSRTLFLGIYSKEFNRTLNTHTCASFFTAVPSTLSRQTPRSKMLYTHTKAHSLTCCSMGTSQKDKHCMISLPWGLPVIEFRDRKWSELSGNGSALDKGSRQWLPDNVKALKVNTESYVCFTFFTKSQKVNQIGRSTPVGYLGVRVCFCLFIFVCFQKYSS